MGRQTLRLPPPTDRRCALCATSQPQNWGDWTVASRELGDALNRCGVCGIRGHDRRTCPELPCAVSRPKSRLLSGSQVATLQRVEFELGRIAEVLDSNHEPNTLYAEGVVLRNLAEDLRFYVLNDVEVPG